MANSNGHDSAASSDSRALRPNHTVFTIGGKDIEVPPLTFWTLEVRDPELKIFDEAVTVREYADAVLLVIATSIEVEKAGDDVDPTAEAINTTFMRFKRRITFGEMKQLQPKINQLLINSGYEATPVGEAAATSPGTETSTDSSQTSSDSESVTAIPSGSSVN